MIMLQKLNKIYPLQLEIIPLALLLLILYLALINYPILPDRIPTHFNLQGFPDGWGSRNEIFIYVGMSLFVYALITGISFALAVTSNPKNLINLPTRIKDSITPLHAEKLRVILVRFLYMLKILILGLDAYLLYSNIEVAFNRTTDIGYWPLLFILAILCVVGFMLFRTFRIALRYQ